MTPGQLQLLIRRHLRSHAVDDATTATADLGSSHDLKRFAALI